MSNSYYAKDPCLLSYCTRKHFTLNSKYLSCLLGINLELYTCIPDAIVRLVTVSFFRSLTSVHHADFDSTYSLLFKLTSMRSNY
jgi:hypothetical protein